MQNELKPGKTWTEQKGELHPTKETDRRSKIAGRGHVVKTEKGNMPG